MNKYIKKCIIMYSALTLILVGMVGITYAITATDADNYVTRSQYAVDMAHLQNKLDEQEAGLMGNINRYRSTDVKFVTYDTPDNSGPGQAFSGGNYFVSKRTGTGDSNYRYCYRGINNTSTGALVNYARFRYITLHRLWNGNYYISNDKIYQTITGTNTTNYHGAAYNCAVPCENLPGYYLIIMYHGSSSSGGSSYSRASLHKLDPNVPSLTAAQITAAGYLKFRFKKDLWQYDDSKTTDSNWTRSKGTTYGAAFYTEGGDPLQAYFNGQVTQQGTQTLYFGRSIDPETGDYIVEVSGFREAYSQNTSSYYYNSNTLLMLIPKDNVEYLMYGVVSYTNNYATSLTSASPSTRYISTGEGIDQYYDYEFVDCVNGIKYLHAYKNPSTNSGGYAYGWHYSLPIVY